MSSKIKLIIVTKNYGKNFTGATLATQYFVERWKDFFDSIMVFTLNVGEYKQNDNVVIRLCDNENGMYRLLLSEKRKNEQSVLGYSDDHLGFLLGNSGITYVHTYHGNWPYARWVSVEFFVKSFYFMPLYRKTIHKAKYIVNVSNYMENFTKQYNKNSVIIHNGMDFKIERHGEILHNSFLMVGNIDSRKYALAIKLAKLIYKRAPQIMIDIYGKIIDDNIAVKLKRIPNISLKGLCNDIPYDSYCGLINTSKIENLSISVCEAIKAEKPVFCFNVGGLSEVVKEKETGYLFEIKDINKMVNKIVEYDKSEKKIKVNASIIDSFDWNIAAKKYIELFMRIEDKVI